MDISDLVLDKGAEAINITRINMEPTPPSKVIPMDDISLLADRNKVKSNSIDLSWSRENNQGTRQTVYIDGPMNHSPMSPLPTPVPPPPREIVIENITTNGGTPLLEPRMTPNEHLFDKTSVLFSKDDVQSVFQTTTPLGGGTMVPSNGIGLNDISGVRLDPLPEKSFDEIQREKQDLLFKLDRLAKKGVPLTRRYNMSSQLEDIKEEFNRIKSQRDMENSCKFQRKMMMAFVTGVEFLNTKFDPFDVQLDGWSESVHENLDDFDEIFEELHDKYKEKTKIAPEIRLMMSLTGSAFMYHLSQSLFKSVMPSANDIMNQNPDLMKQFGQAAMNSMNGANPMFKNFVNDAMPDKYKPDPVPNTPPRREMKGPRDLPPDFFPSSSSSPPAPAPPPSTPAVDVFKNIEVSTPSGELRRKRSAGINLSF